MFEFIENVSTFRNSHFAAEERFYNSKIRTYLLYEYDFSNFSIDRAQIGIIVFT